ncbi:hypothetical protein GEA64_22795 [Photorhabdus khanii]|uniref:Uncharacterized protein n=1 Tax=Photorhabdus khanii TaxID=1004150 RepID=A0A7C9KJ39_9GAMM|nr:MULTISPECIES: hypothetical protein [Photorhabdus]MQL50604.1 hypothetical protein [Photorhabdus khanii]
MTENKPECRVVLMRMITANVLFILLCEYALSGSLRDDKRAGQAIRRHVWSDGDAEDDVKREVDKSGFKI